MKPTLLFMFLFFALSKLEAQASKQEIPVRIFPNPISTVVEVYTTTNDSVVTITDLIGVKVAEARIEKNHTRVDVSALHSLSYYFVTVGDVTIRLWKQQ